MGIDKSFEIGSYIATIFSAATAFFAIRQSIMQRKLSIKPQLLIKRMELLAKNIDKNKFSPSPFKDSDLALIQPSIINTGLGSALNIIIKWDYPYEHKMSEIKECYNVLNKEARLEYEINNKLGVKCLEIDTGDIILYNITNTELIDFIAPVNIEKNEYKSKVPSSIFTLMINDVMTLLYINNKLTKVIEGPTLYITYTDVEGKKYTMKYSSHFIVNQITPSLYTNSISGTLYFDAEKTTFINRIIYLSKKRKESIVCLIQNKLKMNKTHN